MDKFDSSELPISIHTLKNFNIIQYSDIDNNNNNDNDDDNDDDDDYEFPPNITSISFTPYCPHSYEPLYEIPNSIKKLKFKGNSSENGVPLSDISIPDSVENLNLGSNKYNLKELPNSIKKLKFALGESNYKCLECLPINLESLIIDNCSFNIGNKLKLFELSSIKKL